MYQAYKYRIYPTSEQSELLAKSFGCCRWFWNYSLSLCHETYKDTGKSLSRAAIQKMLPTLKKEHEWLRTDTYSQCLQVVALNLSTAYKNFFEQRAKLPRFKSKKGRQSISYPQNIIFKDDYIKLPKIGLVYCRLYRNFVGEIKTITISKNPDSKYFASVLVDNGKEISQKSTVGKVIGIDLGITHFCITTEGYKYVNPKHIAKHAINLKGQQQKLARKQKGSNNRNKAKEIAKVQGKIVRCHEDFLHKLSCKIVNENHRGAVPKNLSATCITVENLGVKNMVKKRCDPATTPVASGRNPARFPALSEPLRSAPWECRPREGTRTKRPQLS
ncbi:MAG: RNA-guided endonuclease TnpB family protein [Trichodesmium sp. MO_231.B1]|nr:RNA-guided endonuclease TnpB family protein [Trichodesmium sp. MO_231.B1]